MDDSTILILVAIWLISALGAYLIAIQKGAFDAATWGLAGLLLGPIGLVIAAVLAKPPRDGTVARVCMNCGKTVAPDRDRLCNHCGQPFAVRVGVDHIP